MTRRCKTMPRRRHHRRRMPPPDPDLGTWLSPDPALALARDHQIPANPITIKTPGRACRACAARLDLMAPAGRIDGPSGSAIDLCGRCAYAWNATLGYGDPP